MSVAKRYAKAIFELALEQGRLEAIGADLALVRETLVQNPDWQAWLANPQVAVADKQEAVRRTYGDKVAPEVVQLLSIMLKNKRATRIVAVVDEYRVLLDEHQGIVHAHVSSAFPLTEAEEANITASFEKLTGKSVVLHKEVDPELIGGILVRIGDRLYDGSVRGLLQRLEKRLVTA